LNKSGVWKKRFAWLPTTLSDKDPVTGKSVTAWLCYIQERLTFKPGALKFNASGKLLWHDEVHYYNRKK
jgi:hypothetical protein